MSGIFMGGDFLSCVAGTGHVVCRGNYEWLAFAESRKFGRCLLVGMQTMYSVRWDNVFREVRQCIPWGEAMYSKW